MKILVFLICCVIYETNAYLSAGNCLVSPIIPDFQPAKYAGDWYEILRVPALNEMNLKCVRTRYGVLNATTLSVHNGGTNIKTNQSAVTDGFAVSKNSSSPNIISVYFPSITGDAPQPYDVWNTDYNSFTCVYACKQIIPNLLKYETIWVLSRQPTIDNNLLDKLISFYKSKGVPVEIFEKTDQTNCVYV